ncbi:hypothetical protein [Streptomyces sp. CBMA152]|uniref:hypothetical protein n=1 Tax=Streptomyces sp. CBMA152 TaxID=1896312 RepID=UPI001660C718|nr:hypothetical protein [Streptomyces sp. CBMA152]MBD0745401.1 hypothetical protein [Streptomyces sp. CBMA152]
MGDIAKGVLGGAWTLLVGWILPTALNLGVFALAVAPSLRRTAVAQRLWPGSAPGAMLVLLTSALLFGLVLSALQNLLYRLLEGYVLWPARAYEAGCRRARAAQGALADRLLLLGLERRRRDGTALAPLAAADLVRVSSDPRLARAVRKDRRRTSAQRALLQERLSRFPVDSAQIAPTRLGNAIRRFEEYGHDRYRLDTQLLWNELTGAGPDKLCRQVELARTSVDFFVALLAGHTAVALIALATLPAASADVPLLLTTAVALGVLVPLWYRAAVTATDEWAASVRALVNAGRKPLADALGLVLPKELAEERKMWTMVSRLSRIPFHERASALDRYRAAP